MGRSLRRRAVRPIAPPFLDPPQHQLRPLVGYPHAQEFPPHLLGKVFLADVPNQVAGTEFLGATVIVIGLVPLHRHPGPAHPAPHEAQERHRLQPLLGAVAPPAALQQDPLDALEKLHGDNALVCALVLVARPREKPDVEPIRKNLRNHAAGDGLFLMAQKPPLRSQFHHLVVVVAACRIGLEQSPDHRGFLLVHFDGPQARFVHIAQRRFVRIDAPPNLLPHTPPHILRKRIHIIFRLSERHIEDEFPLRRVLKPECRELQRRDFPRVHQPDDFSAVHAVAGEAVWMPRQQRIRFALLHP
ncbi:MAG: hypothetical protein BWX54_02319 [Verrucomicrobia bacterium ADurb.Bin018]|nr:MAG: hypothetical protein BWX54_02319 [Verrucomicrobia bacterium ADurb.Bin018]